MRQFNQPNRRVTRNSIFFVIIFLLGRLKKTQIGIIISQHIVKQSRHKKDSVNYYSISLLTSSSSETSTTIKQLSIGYFSRHGSRVKYLNSHAQSHRHDKLTEHKRTTKHSRTRTSKHCIEVSKANSEEILNDIQKNESFSTCT